MSNSQATSSEIVDEDSEWSDAYEVAYQMFLKNGPVKSKDLDEFSKIICDRYSDMFQYDVYADTYTFINQKIKKTVKMHPTIREACESDIHELKTAGKSIILQNERIKVTPIVFLHPYALIMFNCNHVKHPALTGSLFTNPPKLIPASERDITPGALMLLKGKDQRFHRVFVLLQEETMKYLVVCIDARRKLSVKLSHLYCMLADHSLANIPCSLLVCRLNGIIEPRRSFSYQLAESVASHFQSGDDKKIDCFVVGFDRQQEKHIVDFPSLNRKEKTEAEICIMIRGYSALAQNEPPVTIDDILAPTKPPTPKPQLAGSVSAQVTPVKKELTFGKQQRPASHVAQRPPSPPKIQSPEKVTERKVMKLPPRASSVVAPEEFTPSCKFTANLSDDDVCTIVSGTIEEEEREKEEPVVRNQAPSVFGESIVEPREEEFSSRESTPVKEMSEIRVFSEEMRRDQNEKEKKKKVDEQPTSFGEYLPVRKVEETDIVLINKTGEEEPMLDDVEGTDEAMEQMMRMEQSTTSELRQQTSHFEICADSMKMDLEKAIKEKNFKQFYSKMLVVYSLAESNPGEEELWRKLIDEGNEMIKSVDG